MRLVDVTRDGYLESWHTGALILLDPSGAVAVSTGSVDEPVFPRSSLKPLQAVAMLEAGFAGRDASLALAAASHDGESVHLAGARATLAAAGLDESALQCPPDLPSGRAALREWVEAGGQPAPICHNCSGKHAAMLATCVAADWPIDTYRSPDHPLQRAARARIESLCREPVGGVAVDGCGAPAFSVSLHGLARGFATLATSASGPPHGVAAAMRTFPRLIGGTGRAVSQLTAAVLGLVAKEGADGVWRPSSTTAGCARCRRYSRRRCSTGVSTTRSSPAGRPCRCSVVAHRSARSQPRPSCGPCSTADPPSAVPARGPRSAAGSSGQFRGRVVTSH
jgi:L-asparaginase II